MEWNYVIGVDGPDSPRFCPGPAGYMRLWDLFCVSQQRPKYAVCCRGDHIHWSGTGTGNGELIEGSAVSVLSARSEFVQLFPLLMDWIELEKK